MFLRGAVEGRGYDFAVDGARHVRDFLRAFVDKQHHEDDFRVVRRYRVGEALEQRRFSRLRRRDDERALALAYRREYVDDARRYLAAVRLKLQFFVREYRRQGFEVRTPARLLWVGEVHVLDAEQRFVVFLILRRTDDAPDDVAVAQAEASYLRGRDVDVVAARQKPRRTKEAVALGHALERSAVVAVAERLRLRFEYVVDEVVFSSRGYRGDAGVLRDLSELREGLSGELAESELGMLVAYLPAFVALYFGLRGLGLRRLFRRFFRSRRFVVFRFRLLFGAVFRGGLLGFFRLRGCRFFGLRFFRTGFSALFRAEDSFLARLIGLLYAASALRGLLLLDLRRLRRGRGFGLFFFLSSAARLRLFFALRRGRFSCVASFLFDLRLFAVRSLRRRGLRFSRRRLFDGLALRPCSSLYAGRFVV